MTARSQNGYKAGEESLLATFTFPGTHENARLRKGAAGNLLMCWARWFNDHIEKLDTKPSDDWSYAYRPIRGQTSGLSNHASGTAIDLNATKHPRGVAISKTFTTKQIAAIRTELLKYDGAIRWGGDYQHSPVDGMHFEINANLATVRRVLKEVTMPEPNRVQQARTLVAEAEKLLKATPKDRTVCHNQADRLADVLKILPKK